MSILGKVVANNNAHTLVYTVPNAKRAVMTISATNTSDIDVLATISIREKLDLEINSITINNSGNNYIVKPEIQIGPDGTLGACSVTHMRVESLTLSNAGQGYNVGNILTFAVPSGGQLVGEDSATIEVTGVDESGTITAFVVRNKGTYTDIITNTGNTLPLLGDTGTNAAVALTGTPINYGLKLITVDNAGMDYSAAPVVTANPGNAVLTAVMVSDSVEVEDAIEYNVLIPPSGVVERSAIVIDQGDSVLAQCDHADSLNVFIFGLESIM